MAQSIPSVPIPTGHLSVPLETVIILPCQYFTLKYAFFDSY